MKIIKYQMLTEVNHGTEENPDIVQTFFPCTIKCSDDVFEANLAIAQADAYNGEVTVEEVPDEKITAPHNIVAGEYVTINGVLYLATENIPNGEPVIAGQNAIITTVEAQLRELKGE